MPKLDELSRCKSIFAIGMFFCIALPSVAAGAGLPVELLFFASSSDVPLVQARYALALVAFLVGYHVSRARGRHAGDTPANELRTPPPLALITLALVPLVVQFLAVGADAILAIGSNVRGYGQNDITYTRYLEVIGAILAWPICVIAGYGWTETRQRLYILVPFIGCFVPVALFSRGMFLPISLFLLVLGIRGPRRLRGPFLISALLTALCGFYLGMLMRETFPTTGIGRYIELTHVSADPSAERSWQDVVAKTVDSVETLSVPSCTFALYENRYDEAPMYLLQILPIPSFLLSDWVQQVAMGISHDLHFADWNSPYPTLAEVWIFLGPIGVWFVYLAFGVVAERIDRALSAPKTSWITFGYYCVFVYLIVRSYHSGLRSCTRLLIYFALLHLAILAARRLFSRARPRPQVQRPPSAAPALAVPERVGAP